MKKFFTLLCAASVFLTSQELAAMSVGREGKSYVENNIPWQKHKYENTDAGFTGSFPGISRSGLSNGDVFVYSQYQNVAYEIHTSLTKRFTAPITEKEFLRQIEEAFAREAAIKPLSLKQKNVKYVAELFFRKESKIVRVYCSKNALYWAIVQGQDLSLAPLFFEHVQVTK